MAGLAGQQYAAQNAVQAEARMRQIPEKISELGCLAERLCGQAKTLEERLQSVLMKQSEGADDGRTKAPRPILVGHAAALDNIGSQLCDAAEFIDSILRRLEV